MKKCFTINPNRTKEEIKSYETLLKNNVYQAVEIFYPYNKSSNQFIEYTNELQDILHQYPSVEFVLHLPHGLENGITRKEDLEKNSLQILLDGSDYAKRFNVKKLTLHLGHIDKNLSREENIANALLPLRRLCEHALNNNQVVMIENMPNDSELGYSPEEILTIIKNINMTNLKFIFDTGHAHVSKYEDTSFIYLLKDYLYHIHYSDNKGVHDEHKYLGSGTIDFKAHFKALKDINYDQLHCMEIIYQNVDDLKKYADEFNNLVEGK